MGLSADLGKKRIIVQTNTDSQVDTSSGQPASSAEVKKSARRQVINGVAYISVSYNNTMITITDQKGEVIAWSSAGLLGFKGAKKSTPYAANLVAKDCFEKARKFNLMNIKIIVYHYSKWQNRDILNSVNYIL